MHTSYHRFRRSAGVLALAGLTMLAGCALSVTRHCDREPRCDFDDGAHSTEDPTFAEIHAAGRLGFDSSRAAALTNIAQRPDLQPAAQVHLVRTALRRLKFESSKRALLMALIENPALSPAAKRCILGRLDHLKFDSTKTAILKAMRDRPARSDPAEGAGSAEGLDHHRSEGEPQ